MNQDLKTEFKNELEAKEQRYNKLLECKLYVIEIRRTVNAEYSRYQNALKKVCARKGLKRKDRMILEELMGQKYRKNLDKIKIKFEYKYKEILQYIISNGLNNDLHNDLYNDFRLVSMLYA